MSLKEKLKDANWLAKTAVHLITVNLPGLADQLSQTLAGKIPRLPRGVVHPIPVPDQ